LTFNITDSEGKFLINLAREAVTVYVTRGETVKPPPDTPNKLKAKSGVFVTLNKVNGTKTLRGCIGYPEPVAPLVEAVIDSAINAAVNDPRFQPVSKEEVDKIVIEVSILTPPERIQVKNPKDYLRQIKVGEDGLIVESGWNKGLLLPQVPVEYKWNTEEFLCNCCMKAMLTPDSWLMQNTKIYKFQAIVYGETTPKGAIKRIRLKNS
jgi:uncharacterized protein (TIGR00296 family)